MNRRDLFLVSALCFVLGASFLLPSTSLFALEATSTASANAHNAALVEEKVRSLFSDVAVMAEIARCESKFRQYTDSGNTLRGGAGGKMIGVFQFSENVHVKAASSLGFDLYSLDGNLAYADYIYKKSGTDPWISSFACWSGAADVEQGTESGSSDITRNLSFGQTHSQVLTLQQALNALGFTVSSSGPGSPGQETTMFGNLTRAAVRKFQCAQKISCGGDEYSTGYGYVDAKTRTALLSYKGSDSQVTPREDSVQKPAKNKDKSPAPTKAEQADAKQAKADKASAPTSAEQAKLQDQIDTLIKLIAALEAQLALLMEAN